MRMCLLSLQSSTFFMEPLPNMQMSHGELKTCSVSLNFQPIHCYMETPFWRIPETFLRSSFSEITLIQMRLQPIFVHRDSFRLVQDLLMLKQ